MQKPFAFVVLIFLIGNTAWAQDFADRFHNFTETSGRFFIDMMAVEGSTFTMGCTAPFGEDCFDDEKPTHKITLSRFYISKYPVSQQQWLMVMGSHQSRNRGCRQCPVESVSWEDVKIFLKRLREITGKNYNLPTEAQLELSARGGVEGKGYVYSGSNDPAVVAWMKSNSDGTRPVGGKSPNELGIYDMSGNVWELCLDWKERYTFGPKTDPVVTKGRRKVLRSDDWNSLERSCRVSKRHDANPQFRNNYYGFRLVLTQSVEW
ncbi:MAG: formylglycine-generating enzyme family protein [Bacteroidota bacterium]